MASKSSYSTYQEIKSPTDHTYKLLQLTPDLLDYIKSNEHGELLLKSPPILKNHIVLVTDNKTWKMRQMNHSNSVLLLNNMKINKLNKTLEHIIPVEEPTNQLLGIANLAYEYELSKIPGYIEIGNLPTYDGNFEVANEIDSSRNVEALMNDSPISREEFYKEWYTLCGCEIEGKAVILSKEFITDGLQLLIPILITKDIDYKSDAFNINISDISKEMRQQNRLYTQEVTITILHKFCIKHHESSMFKLNNLAVAKWFGIQTLFSTNANLISPKDFLLKWKSSFPPFYNVPIDLSQMRGYYCRPLNEQIQFLNPSTLTPGDMSIRVKELFQIVKEWEYEEFLPFIEEFIPKGKKPESIVLKYAKKKRVGKNRFMVCPR